MIPDPFCLNCDEHHFELADVEGRTLHFDRKASQYSGGGNYYFNAACPVCNAEQAVIVQPGVNETLVTLWPCSWRTDGCQDEECEYCGGAGV